MQPVTVSRRNCLFEDGYHLCPEIQERFGGAQTDQAVRIRQPAQQQRGCTLVKDLSETHDGAQAHEPYRVRRQFCQNVERKAGLHVRQRPSNCGSQFVEIIFCKLQQVHPERRCRHLAEYPGEDLANRPFGMLQIRQQQLWTLCTGLDQCALQWKRGHCQSYLAHPYQNLPPRDRKSTRLNSSHGYISYAVFCLKKKKKN